MADCPPNISDCLPAGSNNNDPCSPCFEPTKESFLTDLATIARQVCAIGNQVKSFNQRLDRVRNRMERLERTIDNLPEDEEASALVNPCANMDSATRADGILVCDDGEQKIFPAQDCGHLVSKDGEWILADERFRKITVQNLIVGSNTSLSGYDEAIAKGCNVLAVLQHFCTVSGNSTTGGTRLYTANQYFMGAMSMTGGGTAATGGQMLVPMTSESLTIATAGSFVGAPVFSQTFQLIGWLIV